MSNHLKSMNEIKQVLRLFYERNEPIKSIARHLGMSKNTVKEYLRRFDACGMDLQTLLSSDTESLGIILRPEHASVTSRYADFVQRADDYLDQLSKNKHLTKQVLWEEEFAAGRTSYRYSQFCHYLQQYAQYKKVSMVMQFEPGDKLEIDFAGDKLYVIQQDSGKLTPCEVLVVSMAHSRKTICVALPNQRSEQVIYGLNRALLLLGAVPKSIVCDNMKTAVVKSDRYEPILNELLLDWANYYGINVLPTRVRKPKDKARVEGGVNHLYSQVYGRIRDETFYSLEQLNQALERLCTQFNDRVMKSYGSSRQAIFLRDEIAHMKPLPNAPYAFVKQLNLMVGNNAHVHIAKDKQYYSVPYRLIGQRVKVVCSCQLIKIYHHGACVATHAVTGQRYTTVADHMPSQHNAYLQGMNPEWLEKQAQNIGSAVRAVVVHVLGRSMHPEQNYKTCQGILSLARKHDHARLNAACKLALESNCVALQYLKKQCENIHFTPDIPPVNTTLPTHQNVRGAATFA